MNIDYSGILCQQKLHLAVLVCVIVELYHLIFLCLDVDDSVGLIDQDFFTVEFIKMHFNFVPQLFPKNVDLLNLNVLLVDLEHEK